MLHVAALKPTTLKSSLSASASSVILAALEDRHGEAVSLATFGEWGTIVVKSGDQWECIKFDGLVNNADGSVTLSVATNGRKILPVSPFTGSSTGFDFNAGSDVIVTNDGLIMSTFGNTENAQSWNEIQTFVQPPVLPTPSAATDGANKQYVDDVAVAGAPDASTTVKGIVEEATQDETDARTGAGGTGAELYINPATLRATKYSDPATSGGSANAYTLTVTPAIAAYAANQVFIFKANFANTGSATLNVSGLGAKTIKKLDGATNLAANDIASGQVVICVYDGTNMQMLTPVSSGPGIEYGDGSDGAMTADGATTYNSFSALAGSTYSLSRDTFLTNLTGSTGVIINTNGYQLFINGTLTQNGTFKIVNNGSDGGAGGNGGNASGSTGGTAGTAGTAGAAAPGVTVPAGIAGVAGGIGIAGANASVNGTNGTNGIAGSNATNSLGSNGVSPTGTGGGTTGTATGGGTAKTGGTAAAGGTATASKSRITSPTIARLVGLFVSGSYSPFNGNAGNPGGPAGAAGGAGGSSSSGGSGGGGGSGSNGGWVVVFVRNIVVNSGVTLFQSKGGAGGNGGTAGNSSGADVNGSGGGGAGMGGNGGIVVVVYNTKSAAITYDVTGGANGSNGSGKAGGGTTGGTGSNGSIAGASVSGTSVELQLP